VTSAVGLVVVTRTLLAGAEVNPSVEKGRNAESLDEGSLTGDFIAVFDGERDQNEKWNFQHVRCFSGSEIHVLLPCRKNATLHERHCAAQAQAHVILLQDEGLVGTANRSCLILPTNSLLLVTPKETKSATKLIHSQLNAS
jgi:hypothetical protein